MYGILARGALLPYFWKTQCDQHNRYSRLVVTNVNHSLNHHFAHARYLANQLPDSARRRKLSALHRLLCCKQHTKTLFNVEDIQLRWIKAALWRALWACAMLCALFRLSPSPPLTKSSLCSKVGALAHRRWRSHSCFRHLHPLVVRIICIWRI